MRMGMRYLLTTHLNEISRAESRLVLQGLRKDKGVAQENYSKYDNRTKELGIPLAKKRIRVICICILRPRLAEARNEWLMREEAGRLKGFGHVSAPQC